MHGERIQDKWQVGPCFQSGAFGDIYMAFDTDMKPFVVKMEPNEVDLGEESALLNEKKIYEILHETSEGSVGFPSTYFFGDHDIDKVLVMDCLGISLHQYMISLNKGLPAGFALQISMQALERVEFMHKKGLLHRDIKPANFVFGYEDKECLYMIDFGTAEKFIDEKTGQHIPLSETRSLVGTADFISLNGHCGMQLSRKDDLESLGFLMIYLFKGALPWMSITSPSKEDLATEIYCSKLENTPPALCKGLPTEICEYFDYVRGLSFTESPNYCLLKEKLREATKRYG